MRGKEFDDWAMYSQIAMTHKAPHQTAWLVERHDAAIRSASRAEAQVIKESLCISSNIVFGLATSMHNAFVSIINRIP